MTPGEIIAERGKIHGEFKNVAALHDALMAACEEKLSQDFCAEHRLALSMALLKIARIVCGNANYADSWLDLAGYAELGRRACEPQEVPFQ